MVNRTDRQPALRMDRAQVRAVQAACRAAWPDEACGLLLGARAADGGFTVDRVLPMRNLWAGRAHDRFEIAPADLLAQHRAARQTGKAVIGHFHSHPGGQAWPSATDAVWASEPGVVWLIQALGAQSMGEMRAFRSEPQNGDAGSFTPLAILIHGD